MVIHEALQRLVDNQTTQTPISTPAPAVVEPILKWPWEDEVREPICQESLKLKLVIFPIAIVEIFNPQQVSHLVGRVFGTREGLKPRTQLSSGPQ